MILPPTSKKHFVKKIFDYFVLFFTFTVLLFVTLMGVQWFSNSVQSFFTGTIGYYDSNVFVAGTVAAQKPPLKPTVHLKLDADSAISLGFSQGVPVRIFSKEAQKKLPIASLTKLMTALVVLENYELNSKIVISKNAMAQEGEQGRLTLNESLSVKDLLYISLIESSNRATYALSEVMGLPEFLSAMNKKSLDLGMINTHFTDSTGLGGQSYSTAEDLAKLSEYLFLHYPLFNEIISLKEYNLYVNGVLHHRLVNTNKLLGTAGIIGGKTGWTNEARGCFMVIQKTGPNGNYFVHIVLGAEDRFLEMQKLINLVQNDTPNL